MQIDRWVTKAAAFLTAGVWLTSWGLMKGAIAQASPDSTSEEPPQVCQFAPDRNLPQTLNLEIRLPGAQGESASVKIQPQTGLSGDFKRFERAIAQELNQQIKQELKQQGNLQQWQWITAYQEVNEAEFRKRFAELMTTVFLNTGYLTTKVETVSKPTETLPQDSQPRKRGITFEVVPGQLIEIQPTNPPEKDWRTLVEDIGIETSISEPDNQLTELYKQWIQAHLEKPLSQLRQPWTRKPLSSNPKISGLWMTYICERVRRGVGYPLNANDLEDQLRLLREDSAIGNIEGVLKKSQAGKCSYPVESQLENNPSTNDQLSEGKSCLDVFVTKANPTTGSVGVDNYSPPSVGSVRASAELRYRNPILVGDELGVVYSNTFTGGNELLEFNYRLPLNPANGTLQFRAVPRNPNRITEEQFALLKLQGSGELYDITYRQPVIRTPRRELALFAGFTAQNSRIFSEDPLVDQLFTPFVLGFEKGGVSRTRVLKLGADYLTRTTRSAVFLRGQLNIGTGWLGATTNPAPIPDSQFFSALIQGQWIQRIKRDIQFLVQADLQLTPDVLLPSQQFVIGGGQSVRGLNG